MASRYAELGVDVRKEGVEAFKPLMANLFPEAFCVVTGDPGLPGFGMVLHADCAGSKPIVSYLAWRETGDPRFFGSLAQDVLAMNVDDVLCVAARPLGFVDLVALNPFKVPKAQVLRELSRGFRECLELLRRYGIDMAFAGGETADLPDQIMTLNVSGTVLARVRLEEAVTGQRIQEGDLIIGLASDGKAVYEERVNSGLMCNGITLARRCLLKPEYGKRYPEVVAPEGRPYDGRFDLDECVEELGMTVQDALTSPTRLFAPVVLRILEEPGSQIKGLVHNTGGGQTKCLRLGRGVHYVKDRLLPISPLFQLIQRESGESWQDMFQDFNMGTGFEVIVAPEGMEAVLEAAEKLGVKAAVVGKCLRSPDRNRLTIKSPFGSFDYEA